ncbi:hypothetical protein LTR36_004940 [Oleoguttula mirabilis]|uniref:Uncharacterized protein n=1 Tax=Oleoguttula mirabilis TaxID=1507867 RepID=A0AAV9JV81_9PEZI|nr:hypothetical protein LTR36_004940 [Oleoguttula mirabilis]
MGAPTGPAEDDAHTTRETAPHSIPTHEENVNMDDQDDDQTYAPPAHLAARFYRNRANARRKSSAASSRRNSLSSAHSHTSSRRGSGVGCQSNHVAQHLRRASIIESRKARLADRAAHAEQVRLRAALAKATPRGSTSISEERALAAQVAKEKYLAKVAATCAEEVARAKRIAEEVKERKLLEEARVRLEMEERHAEVEKRRAEYQRNLQARRVRRADSTEKKLAVVEELGDLAEEPVEDEPALSEESASRRIQTAWRLSRKRRVVSDFVKLDLNMGTQADFDDMTVLLANPTLISTTIALLTQLGLQDADNAALNTKTFLSAYLMTAHPMAVLSNKTGAQEQDLMGKASDLLTNFENTLARLAAWNSYAPSATQLERLSQSYSSYTSAFAAWRLQDSSVLIEGMVASFVELDAIWQTVKDDSRGEVTNDYREGIRDNQVMLLSSIRKLAGADRADTLIKKAIRESRKRRPKRRNAAEVRPRGVEPSSSNEVDISGTEDNAGTSSSVLSLSEETHPQSTADVTRKLFTPMPSNRVLTHELAIDKDYKLADSSDTTALRDDLYRSICAAMRQGFEAGSGNLWTVSAAENIREKLLRMLKPGNSMHTLIRDTLDLDSINRQCQAGVFSYDGFFGFMANVLPKLCAPFRDAEIAALCQQLQDTSDTGLDSMIDKLFKLLRAVDALSLDYSNFMLMSAAPTLIKEAPGYEARAFAADLEAGKVTLEGTKRWWQSSLNHLSAEADRRDPEGHRIDRPTAEKIYARALADLAIEPNGALEPDILPETLVLDLERLRGLRRQAVRITVIGAVLLTAKNLLKRDVRGQWKNEATRLWQLLAHDESFDGSSGASSPSSSSSDEPTTAQKAFSILETAHNMPPATKQQLAGTIARLFGQAAAAGGARFSDPVLKVMFQRLRTHVLMRLSASTSSERVRAAASASDALTSCGLGEMVTQVSGIVDTLEKVRAVDWQAHGRWYEQIASVN